VPAARHLLLGFAAFAALLGWELGAPTELLSSASAASQGPIAAYSFDAESEETAEDVSGNEHTGTVEGATWTDRGKYGGALQFDGESCVHVPDSADLELSEEFTLEAWVKPEGGDTSDPAARA
jgi:hypothetical protein